MNNIYRNSKDIEKFLTSNHFEVADPTPASDYYKLHYRLEDGDYKVVSADSACEDMYDYDTAIAMFYDIAMQFLADNGIVGVHDIEFIDGSHDRPHQSAGISYRVDGEFIHVDGEFAHDKDGMLHHEIELEDGFTFEFVF